METLPESISRKNSLTFGYNLMISGKLDSVFRDTVPLMYFPIQLYICFGESADGLLLLNAQV